MTQGADMMEDTSLNAESIRAALSDQNYDQSLRNSKIDLQYWNQYRPAWNRTAMGRLASRLVSRGVVGAAFYVVGGHYAAKNMATYDPSKRPTTIYQWVAYSIDKLVSRPLEGVVNRINGKGKDFVTFRPTLKNDANRSLGKEVILGNADFAMASMGDALGRELLGLVDAAHRKAWHDERGNLSGKLLSKHLGRSLFQIILAQCPDWFVSVPYAFQQKFQRKVLNRFFPGFEAAGDSTLHGANHRVDKDGNLNGTYALAGAIDLQARFTGYNWGTGLFQDIVNKVDQNINGTSKPANPDQPKKSFFTRGMEYMVVRTVKTMLIMTPSIPLFSLLRVPQGKHRGIAIDPDGNTIIRDDLKGRAGYELQENASLLDKITNPFGKMAYTLSSKAMRITQVSGANQSLVENWVNASLAYTPYIWAKNELQYHFDSEEMNRAILKMVKNLVKGRFSEAKEGMVEMTQAMRPKSPPPPHVEMARRTSATTPQDIIQTRQSAEAKGQSAREAATSERASFTPQDILQTRPSPEAQRQSMMERASSATERVTNDRKNAPDARIAAGV